MYIHSLRMQDTPYPTEVEGRNGWFKLVRLVISVVQGHAVGKDDWIPLMRLEGFAKRSTWRAPVMLECANVADIRALAAMLLAAADNMEHVQGDPHAPTTD